MTTAPINTAMADTAELTKVDSAVSGMSSSPIDDKKIGRRRTSSSLSTPADRMIGHRRTSSSVSGVFNINDLEKEKVTLAIAPETQHLNWKLNTSPGTIEEKDVLKKFLCTPPVKKIDLHFPFGLEVTARNMKGVTIKDALDAIHKQYKKKADDEMENPILAGFEWDKDECYTRFIVHQKKVASAPLKKSKKNKGEVEE